MKSTYAKVGCNCGLSDGEPSKEPTETAKDAVKAAKNYSNSEIPIYFKIGGGIALIALLGSLTSKKKK